MGPFGSDLELAELLMRTLCDESPPQFDIAYLFGQTADNQESVLGRGIQLYTGGGARLVGITDHPPVPGYPGTEVWRGKLLAGGVPAKDIVSIPRARPLAHTHTEAERLIWLAQTKSWHTILIVAAPFHQLRAFMDTVGVLIRDGLDKTIRIYNDPGITLPWTRQAVHSQGTLTARRYELVGEELGRIVRYWGKGDMPTTRQVLDYLNWREDA